MSNQEEANELAAYETDPESDMEEKPVDKASTKNKQ